MHLNLHKKASKYLIIINSDTDYLKKKSEQLGYKVFSINNLENNSLIKKNINTDIQIFRKYLKYKEKIKLIYGSGLEGQKTIYDFLNNNFEIKGNNLKIIESTNNILKLRKHLHACGLKIPKTTLVIPGNKSNYLSKPFSSYGGLNIKYATNKEGNVYYQKYISGPTYSISFFIHKNEFIFLGFNKLIQLINYEEHPFIHAGAIKIDNLRLSNKIKKSVKQLSQKLKLNGYNSFDFKLFNNDIYILDINPRITSTFKIYNNMYSNKLLNMQINPDKTENLKINSSKKKYFGFIYMFSKKNQRVCKSFLEYRWISDFPQRNNIIKQNEPIFTINASSNSFKNLIINLKNKINITMKHHNCYDVSI